MRFRKLFFVLILVIPATFSIGIPDEDESQERKPKPIEKVWRLACIINKEKSKISWPQKDHYMELKKDSIVNVALDINFCRGYYYILDSTNIVMNLNGCSIQCCDGFTALSFTDAFPDTFSYKLTPDSLELHSLRYSMLFHK